MQRRALADQVVVASPALVDGLLLVGSEDHLFYALDAASGALRWKFQTSLGIASSPAVAGGSVFFGGKGGHVYALNVVDGVECWRSESIRCITAPPLAGATAVYVQGFGIIGEGFGPGTAVRAASYENERRDLKEDTAKLGPDDVFAAGVWHTRRGGRGRFSAAGRSCEVTLRYDFGWQAKGPL